MAILTELCSSPSKELVQLANPSVQEPVTLSPSRSANPGNLGLLSPARLFWSS